MNDSALEDVHWHGNALNVVRGVWEIRVSDRDGAFRIFYIAKRKGRIHVLHAFRKKTRKTSRADIDIGKLRFKNLMRKI